MSNISYKNIYYMLAYATNELKIKGIKDYNFENINNINELLTLMMRNSLSDLIKDTMHREYKYYTNSTRKPQGKLDIGESYKQGLLQQGEVICTSDKLDIDNYYNQIIKCACNILKSQDNILDDNIRKLNNYMRYFKKVKTIDSKSIDWKKIDVRSIDTKYKSAIGVSKLIIDDFIATDEDGVRRVISMADENRMHTIFEKFVREYYKKTYGNSSNTIIDGKEYRYVNDKNCSGYKYMPIARTDITIETPKKILIIDTKYYSEILVSNYKEKRLRNNHINQIMTYINLEKGQSHRKPVEGMLLYAKTNDCEIEEPIKYDMITGHTIYIDIVDLNQEFDTIKNKLSSIYHNNIEV